MNGKQHSGISPFKYTMISHVFIFKIKILNVIVLKYIKIQCTEVPAQHFIFIYSKTYHTLSSAVKCMLVCMLYAVKKMYCNQSCDVLPWFTSSIW